MSTNRYFKIWFPAIGLHALHQIEEGISFFQWYLDNAANIPKWLLIQTADNATTIVNHPEYFVFATSAQLLFIIFVAFILRNKEKITKIALVTYILGLTFFLVWHIIISYLSHSYAPILITCIGGMYIIPYLFYKIYNLSKQKV